MGTTVNAFSEALETSVLNPLLILLTAAMTLVSLGLGGIVMWVLFAYIFTGATETTPIVVGISISLATVGSLMAGIVGMIGYAADENRDPTFADFITTLRNRGGTVYANIFLTTLIYAIMIGLFFVSVEAMAHTDDMGDSVGAGFYLIFGVGIFLPIFITLTSIFQFFTVAIVLGNATATGSFNTAFGIVKRNPLSVFGYTLLRGSIFGFLVVGGVAIGMLFASATPVLIIASIPLVIVIIISLTVFYAYPTYYYLSLSETSVEAPV